MSHPGFFQDERAEEGGAIRGVAVGIVTDNEDPKDLGRVKLRFPWRDADDESYWARVATEMAGDGYGTYFIPEVDDEVLVAFQDGDIHKPFVIGSLWNGKQSPPCKNEGGNNDVREVRSRSEHAITFDDADEGSISIKTSAGHEIVVDDSGSSETIRLADESGDNAITLDSDEGTVSIEAASELSLSAPTVSIDGSKKVKVKGKGGVDVSSKAKLSLSSKGQLNVNSNGLMGIDATGPLTIKGAIIQLN